MQFDTDDDRKVTIRRSVPTTITTTAAIIDDSDQPELKYQPEEQYVNQQQLYWHNLQLYLHPPTETISLMEFEKLAIDRLDILKKVEIAREKCSKQELKPHENYTHMFNKELYNTLPKLTTMDTLKATALRRIDHIGHFIVRLAFCRSFEQKNWLLTNELDLFKYRFWLEKRQSIDAFLNGNQLGMQPISTELKSIHVNELAAAANITPDEVMMLDYWTVRFEDALELVRQRKVLILDGFAYISRPDLVVILSSKLRQNMSLAMARAAKYFSFIQQDDRVMSFIEKLSNGTYMNKEYATNSEHRITPDMIDNLASKSFPLCMRQLNDHLRHEHHLRHFGRMQYGLFLKGIGMTVDDAMKFWRMEFTMKIDDEKFDKQYAYGIRHMYGQEGKRADYTAYSCAKIILGNQPGSLDAHGCPFKHIDPELLAQKLDKLDLDINSDQISKIVGFSRKSRYDKACTLFFESTHQMPENALGELITHPNQYFDLSRKQTINPTEINTIDTSIMDVDD